MDIPSITRLACFAILASATLPAQTVKPPVATPPATVAATANTPAPPPATPNRAQILRGAYGPYRANNDLLYYHLDVRVDPVAKSIAGKNTIRFRMLADGSRIQIDLTPGLKVDRILMGATELKYTRDEGAVFIDFPQTLRKGQTYTIDFHYSGNPVAKGRFGGMSFEKDPTGSPWIFTACEDDGASIWWPSKDQWRDEVESMDISVAVPSTLTDVSNGRFVGKTDLGDGYTRWDWHVSYPINSYDVALNIAGYAHFSDTHNGLDMDFYALPADLDKAKKQFAQAKGMLDAFEHYLGEYPFARDGYKLVQVPYAGMEHQSAVAYGNQFDNGYLHVDWTHVGISPRFDFIIVHESGHEWFGNSITANDEADMWIHEAWDTYIESLYVEYHYGKPDAMKYITGWRAKVKNREPIVTERGVEATPPQDMYFKGALMIATLRSMLDDDKPGADARWFALLHDFYQHFKYRNIDTEQVVAWWNERTHRNLTPVFNQYLRHTAIPCLELNFDPATGTVNYKWQAEEQGFNLPIRVGTPGHWQVITPTQQWQVLKTPLTKEQFSVATDLYFVNVSKT
ncbi:Peptidase family M1 [Granulicella rosea]|uniref:Peptidase family M1 n=1 Tax=Granulicella rosea TaxID=474952 RepID=A0A239E1N9_9BACT|nr:M1 family metallopeptidase [Granulicella rosea]SNS38178.1 Peptidase family M1 [Granulicella rosea]